MQRAGETDECSVWNVVIEKKKYWKQRHAIDGDRETNAQMHDRWQ